MRYLLPLAVLALCLTGCGAPPERPAAAAPAPAPVPAPVPAATPFPHEESSIAPDPAVRWGRLPNGARYAIMRSAQPAGRLSLRLRIASGSLLESEPQRGLAHLLEHMAFNGSRHYAPGELIPALQRAGIGFGSAANAHTGFDETVYKIDLPDIRDETVDLGLTVLADQAGGLLIDPAEVERERGVVLAELRDREGPGQRLRDRELALTYAGTALPTRQPIGLAATVAAATAEQLRDYYATWYRPERMTLSAVGDCDLDALEARIRTILGAATALGPVRPEPALGNLTPGLATAALHDAEAAGTAVRLTSLRERVAPADSLEVRREQFLRDLGEAVLARRIDKLVESDPACPLQDGGGFSYPWLGLYLAGASGSAKPGRALDALRLLTREYRRMAEHGPTASELQIEAAGMRARLDAAISQAASRPNRALAEAIYEAVADRRVFTSPAQQREIGLALLASATPEAVRDAFRGGWENRTRTSAIVTGKDDLGPDGDRLVGEALSAVLAEPVTAPVEADAATWGYASDARWDGALPSAHGDPWILGQTNGISLAVMATDFQPGQVLIRLRLSGRTGPRQAGLAELAGRAMLDGGLGKHPASQLGEVLAGTTLRFGGVAIEDGALVANASCAPKDLQRCLEVLSAWLSDAAWRPEAEARAKAPWLEALKAQASDVEAMTWNTFATLTTPDAPWRRSATLEEADATSFTAVRAWIDPLLRGLPLSCAIVGDVDASEAMRLAAGILGGSRPAVAVAADPASARTALPAQPAMPSGEHRVTVPATTAKALVLVSWPTTDQYDIATARRLSLLGGVFNERLREVVREQFGDAYSPSAWHVASDDWAGHGNLTAAIGCAPERIEAVRDATLAIAAGLASGVPATTLDQVRIPGLRGVAERRRQNGWWLGLLARAPEQPFRMEWQKGLEADLQSATSEELTALARTYLVPGKALIVIGTSR
jgi:zinc protease